MNKITVGCKVEIEVADRLKERARERGESLNCYLKQIIEDVPAPTMYEEELARMARVLGTDEFTLLEVVDYLITEKKLYRNDKGKLSIKGMVADPDYLSVDDIVDNMSLTDKEKNRLKQDIISSLENQKDFTGNGGGL